MPPEKLGAYLRDFDALLKGARSTASPTATSATAACTCASTSSSRTAGRGRFRQFIEDAADLVASYGGSMSGEHGDGRARSELLPRMYSPQAIALMQQAKRILDPGNLLNPGVLVDPAPFDADLRLAAPMRRCVRRCGWPTTPGRSRGPSTAAPAWASASPTSPAAAG